MRGTHSRAAFCHYDCLFADRGVRTMVIFQWTFRITPAGHDQDFCKKCHTWKWMKGCSMCAKVAQSTRAQHMQEPLLKKDQVNWQKAREQSQTLKLPQENTNCFNILVNKHCKTIFKYCLCRVLNRNHISLGITKTVKSVKWFYNKDCQFLYIHLLLFFTNLFLMWVLNDQSWWGEFASQEKWKSVVYFFARHRTWNDCLGVIVSP